MVGEEKNTCKVSLVVVVVNCNGREEEVSKPVEVESGNSMVSLVVSTLVVVVKSSGKVV